MFVTWHNPDSTLRGCIGTLEANNSFIHGLTTYAKTAALDDPRFNPITPEESLLVYPSITMLKPLRKINSYNDIILEKHGILLKNGNNTAFFLPNVALEQHWDVITTLEQLSLKAGLKKNAWKDINTTFEVCTGYEIK